MAEEDSPDSKTEEEGTTDSDESNENNHRKKPNELQMRAGKLSIEAKSVDESVGELADIVSGEMECLMRYHIRGELEMIEEEDLHSIILGGD